MVSRPTCRRYYGDPAGGQHSEIASLLVMARLATRHGRPRTNLVGTAVATAVDQGPYRGQACSSLGGWSAT